MPELSHAPALTGIWPPETRLAEEILEATLDLVISLIECTIDAADGVSVSLVSRHQEQFHTPSASSTEVREVDTVQYQTGEGPCVHATRTGLPVNITIASEPSRWPQFREQAAAHGMGSVVSIPLRTGGQVLGALNIYSKRPHAFAQQEERVVGLFAGHAAAVLRSASEFLTSDWLNDQVAESLGRADVVGQAKGILIAKGYSEEEALATLRRASDRTNRKLFDVAQDMVTSSRRGRPS